MRKLSYILLIFLISTASFGQESSRLNHISLLLNDHHGINPLDVQAFHQSISKLSEKLQFKLLKTKNEEYILRRTFEIVHRKYLKMYASGEPFSKLITRGYYNCVTATLLFAIILDEMNYDFDIFETHHHVFISVSMTDGTKILIESTDPFQGFVTDQKVIRNIEKNNVLVDHEDMHTIVNQDLLLLIEPDPIRTIDLHSLIGLYYYNAAANHFEQQDLAQAQDRIWDAGRYYPESGRIRYLYSVLQQISRISGNSDR